VVVVVAQKVELVEQVEVVAVALVLAQQPEPLEQQTPVVVAVVAEPIYQMEALAALALSSLKYLTT
jgi:hypothetical protein